MSGRAIGLVLAWAAAVAFAAAAGAPGTAAAAGQPCPVATCLSDVYVTDGAQGMGSPFIIEDNEGRPPGQNAVMFWVDGYQVGSVNPVCADAVRPYLAREACLGGPPFDASGGHPVLALSPDHGRTWEVLTPADIALLNALRAAGLTPRDVRRLHRSGL